MKRIITLVSLLVILSASPIAFAQSNITDISNEDGYVKISGNTDVVLGNVSYTIVPKETEEIVLNAVSIGETLTDEDGEFNIAIKADFEKSLWSDGEYIVTVRIGDDKVDADFYYYSKERKDAIISAFLLNPSKDSLDSETYKVFCAIGVGLDKIEASDMEELISSTSELLTPEISEEMLVKILNKGVALVRLNFGKNTDLTNVYDEFENYDEVKKKWITEAIAKNRKYKNTVELDNGYRLAQVLYAINHAKHSEIYDYLTDNKDILGGVHEKLSVLSSINRGKACEKIADDLKKHNVYTLKELREVIENAVSESEKSSYSPQSGGGGGGGGKGSSSSQGVIPVIIPQADNTKADTDAVSKKNPFDDLNTVLWASEAIEDLYNKGIVNGVTENKFEPDRAITREEFITMLVRSAGLKLKAGEMDFDDVKENDWYYDAVKIAYTNGITLGTSENKFGAGEYITRQDMAVMISRIFDTDTPEGYLDFKDSDEISDYAKDSVLKLSGAGIINGMEDGTFSPLGNTTRAQAAVVLYRTQGR